MPPSDNTPSQPALTVSHHPTEEDDAEFTDDVEHYSSAHEDLQIQDRTTNVSQNEHEPENPEKFAKSELLTTSPRPIFPPEDGSLVFQDMTFFIDSSLPHDIFVRLIRKITKNGGHIIDDNADSDDDDPQSQKLDSATKNNCDIIKITAIPYKNSASSFLAQSPPGTTVKYVVPPEFIFQSIKLKQSLDLTDHLLEKLEEEAVPLDQESLPMAPLNTRKRSINAITQDEEKENGVGKIKAQMNDFIPGNNNQGTKTISEIEKEQSLNGDENASQEQMFHESSENPAFALEHLGGVVDEPLARNEKTEAKQKKKAKLTVKQIQPSKSSFSPEEDELILAYVRKNPKLRNTHSLYHRIAQVMKNHTGNSVRYRYRKALAGRLDYVYEVDETGALLRDENGDFIKTAVLPKQLKSSYKAEEDYILCLAVKKQFYSDIYHVDPDYVDIKEQQESLLSQQKQNEEPQKSNELENPIALPDGKDSSNNSNEQVSRTEEPAYDTAYLNDILDHDQLNNIPSFNNFKIGNKRGPLKRNFFKNFQDVYPAHTESSWRDRFRKFCIPYGLDDYIAYYEGCLAENIEPEPIKNMTTKHPTPAKYATNADGSSEHAKKLYPRIRTGPGNFPRNYDEDSSEKISPPAKTFLGDTSPAALISVAANAVNATESISNLLPSSISEHHGSAEADSNGNTHSDKNDTTNYFDMFSEVELPMEYVEESKQISPNVQLCEYFEINMDKFENDLSKFLLTISNCMVECIGASESHLIDTIHKETNIPKTELAKILFRCSNDSSLLTRYFFYIFKDDVTEPKDIEGIFSSEDDKTIRENSNASTFTPDFERLLSVHSAEGVMKRKLFLSTSQQIEVVQDN
ncbi:hypothetical protein ACO0RG_000961 [Hanseniaspora osmophila]|uniref:DNA-binding protein RAP1 n=1 Tax=Hanseniaspora osmophila TaxID=56408 RepID=A0A1E5RP55_9ASCO|nr:DNA-binding protein RAP1 [Hanseniaspora osmophila]